MFENLLGTRQRQIIAAVVALVVALGGAGGAFALTNGGGDDDPPAVVQEPTATRTPSPTRTPTATASPTPVPTPPPYDGAVARLALPRLGIDGYIEEVPVVNNEMQVPIDGLSAIGWYYDYSKPGWGENAVFSAHETWNRSQGPFYSLYLATPGDEITVTMDNGIEYRYEVMTNNRYDLDNIPMGEVIWPTHRPEGEEWITLITCGGTIVYNDTGYGEYLQRDVVQARRIDDVTTSGAAATTTATPPASASTR